MMKLKILACKIMARELSMAAWESPNFLDISTLRQSYHNTPVLLREKLQEEIDLIDEKNDPFSTETDFDAIVLGYGLCSNAVLGLKSRRTPLVIPRMHDCISLFLGSAAKYDEVFWKYKGTFFYSHAWTELAPDQEEARLAVRRSEYMEKYQDEDIVDELMEIEKEMVANYHGNAYIEWPEFDDSEGKRIVQGMSASRGWDYYELQGSSRMLRAMVAGDWNPEEFLVVPPGMTVKAAADGSIICAG